MTNENQNIQLPHVKGKSIEQFLSEIVENHLIDDHGEVVIGERKRKPKIPE